MGLSLVGSTFVLCNLGKVFEFEWGYVFFGRDGLVGFCFVDPIWLWPVDLCS